MRCFRQPRQYLRSLVILSFFREIFFEILANRPVHTRKGLPPVSSELDMQLVATVFDKNYAYRQGRPTWKVCFQYRPCSRLSVLEHDSAR